MAEPSIDQGRLRLNNVGRWEIVDSWNRPLAELTSGDVVFVWVGDRWRLTRIEFAHDERRYVSVDGYRLADGVLAALPTA